MTAVGSGVIGVDVGGTHTDVQILLEGTMVRGKALTTYDDFSRGILEAISVAAAQLNLSLDDVLGSTALIMNATTVVTNSIAQMRGCRVGVVVTRGFRDTFRLAGGPRRAVFDDQLQTNVPDLVSRDAIVEVDGRVNAAGDILLELDRGQVEAAVRLLVEELESEAIAVCFISSYANPVHELAAEEWIRAIYPDMFISLSHRVFPVLRETRRWNTTVLNSFVQRDARRYLETVDEQLRVSSFKGSLAFFQGVGGDIGKERAARFPLALLNSGPAAGAIGANELARAMGKSDVLIADMGGTSFDAGIIRDNEVRIEKRVDIGPFQTAVNLVDIVSIGAGGGSIVSIGERGVPLVGPRSAGSTPGPACYRRGGTEATVTDAAVVLGLIDPTNYLGGRVKLDGEAAIESLRRALAEPFGWTVEAAATAVHDLVVANMANALREVSVRKGYDPSDFLFLAYGGTIGMFAWEIAAAIGITETVIPGSTSVFCAQGLLSSDTVLRYDRSVSWRLDDPDDIERVNTIADRMIEQALSDLADEGFDPSNDRVSIQRSGDFQFAGQVYELSLSLPDSLTADGISELTKRFVAAYEESYGVGTAWRGVTPVLLNYTVVARVSRDRPRVRAADRAPATVDEMTKEQRRVFLPSLGEFGITRVVADERFGYGSEITGPAIIDAKDTTIFVPPGVTAIRDELLNYRLRAAAL